MRILFLTQVLPYPPELGASVKTWNVLRYLSLQGHNVTLASFVRPGEADYVPHLDEICKAVYTIPLLRSRSADGRAWLRSILTGRPFLIERDDLPGMRKLVRNLLEDNTYDLIHTDQLTMAQYALPSPVLFPRVSGRRGRNGQWNPKYFHSNATPRLVFDAHNAVWIIMDRFRQKLPGVFHPLYNLEARRIKAYEGMLLNEFDHTLALTQFDREALYEAWMSTKPKIKKKRLFNFYPSLMGPTPITVVPIAVDAGPLTQLVRRPGSRTMLAVGSVDNASDADGIRWFIKKVFPMIVSKKQDIKLVVVAKKVPAELIRFVQAKYSGQITFTSLDGPVKPIIGDCAVVVAPVRLATGTRSYILEAFARGMPVITTSLGLEGIEALPGEACLIGDSPEAFALQALNLIEDKALQVKLSANGLKLAEERYNWIKALKPLDTIYKQSDMGLPVTK
jgi:polysaccharide biosynthesis protein PslH